MTAQGIDYAFDRPTSAAAVRRLGYAFVCRYLGGSKSKDLTRDEAQALIAAGLAIVCNWENSASAALNGFSQGQRDAIAAQAMALACGMPASRPIYLSVDFNATPVQMAAIGAYMDGAASALGRARTGAYGGYAAIKYLFDHGKITWGWQTYAWSAGQWDARAQIRQERNGVLVAGADADTDQGMTVDYGQWGVPMTQPVAQPMRSDPDMRNEFARGDAMMFGVPVRDGQDNGKAHFVVASLNTIVANQAADAVRDAAMLAALNAVTAGGTSVDTAAVLTAIKAVGDAESAAIAALRADNANLCTALARALAG